MYMAVTADELELPIAIGDTAKELGKLVGVSADVIYSSITKKLTGINKKVRFVKVDIEDEEMGVCHGIHKTINSKS